MLYRLGVQLAALGQGSQAEAVWRAALQLAPGNAQLLAQLESAKPQPKDPDFEVRRMTASEFTAF